MQQTSSSSGKYPVSDASASKEEKHFKILHRVIVTLLILASVISFLYTIIATIATVQLVKIAPYPFVGTPANYALSYRDVTFPSREDHLAISGWLIPGVLPNGHLTVQRTIIVIHGSLGNRTDYQIGLLKLSSDLAHQGLAVLAIDLRGHGKSAPAPLSLGYYEQRDILGAVDFLRNGIIPYPQLGRPNHIGGLGISMGASSLLLAAAQEPAIEAIVSDAAYADVTPILEREIPRQGHLPSIFTPEIITLARLLYGIDLSAARPIDAIPRLSTRPIFFIQGNKDTYVPLVNIYELIQATRAAHDTRIETWIVPGAGHAQSFKIEKQIYVNRVVQFFNQMPGKDTTGTQAA